MIRPVRVRDYMYKPHLRKKPHIIAIVGHYVCRFAIHLVIASNNAIVVTMEKSRTEGSLVPESVGERGLT